jgi:hypothetical protein
METGLRPNQLGTATGANRIVGAKLAGKQGKLRAREGLFQDHFMFYNDA